jgi:hypothetical protein
MLDFNYETFDHTMLLAQMKVTVSRSFAVLVEWNYRSKGHEFIRTLQAILDHLLKTDIGKQTFQLREGVPLSLSQRKTRRVTHHLYIGMDLCAEYALATFEGLAFLLILLLTHPRPIECIQWSYRVIFSPCLAHWQNDEACLLTDHEHTLQHKAFAEHDCRA